ncbi:MAG TPA: IS1595 family transposase [Verrucomicrobiae bacterium]|nr:IS1595 family transposase [Verrucomicrobiae bacterium]
MQNDIEFPQTLAEAIKYFADADKALNFVAAVRWPGGKTKCPACKSEDVGFLATRRLWKCRECAKQFSVKVGTIFEDSALGFDKWLPAFWMIVNAKNGISSCELARALGVTQKTAWFMLHRIRLAIQNGSMDKLSGDVEADETYIGGNGRFMSKARREKTIPARGWAGKEIVMGLLERKGKVRLKHITNAKRPTVHGEIRQHVTKGSNVFTDALRSYNGLNQDYVHEVIDHAKEYVRGNVHTNGLENFWSLLKRTIRGTYVSIEPFHLFRYLDEQAFRFNERENTDSGRFLRGIVGIIGKRLEYAKLIGGDMSADGLPAIP